MLGGSGLLGSHELLRKFRPAWRPRNPVVLPLEMLLATVALRRVPALDEHGR